MALLLNIENSTRLWYYSSGLTYKKVNNVSHKRYSGKVLFLMVLENNKRIFDKNNSMALKGVAILLMLCHHLFLDEEVNLEYGVIFKPFSAKYVMKFAEMAKICVPLFVFISGYGLYLSYKNNQDKPEKWIAKRYIKTFSGFWVVWILSAIITQIYNQRVTEMFNKDDVMLNIVTGVVDFLGLANLFNVASINATWWYMSAALIFIIITPLLLKDEKYLVYSFIVSIVFLRVIFGSNGPKVFAGGRSAITYFPIFILGMICAKYNLVNRIINARYRWLRLIVELILVVNAYFMYGSISYYYYWDFHFLYVPFIVILFLLEFVTSLKYVQGVLKFFGRHSMNIFLTHTFIRWWCLKDYTYSFKYAIVIYVVLLFNSLIISFFIEGVKKLTRYDKLIGKLLLKIN